MYPLIEGSIFIDLNNFCEYFHFESISHDYNYFRYQKEIYKKLDSKYIIFVHENPRHVAPPSQMELTQQNRPESADLVAPA